MLLMPEWKTTLQCSISIICLANRTGGSLGHNSQSKSTRAKTLCGDAVRDRKNACILSVALGVLREWAVNKLFVRRKLTLNLLHARCHRTRRITMLQHNLMQCECLMASCLRLHLAWQ